MMQYLLHFICLFIVLFVLLSLLDQQIKPLSGGAADVLSLPSDFCFNPKITPEVLSYDNLELYIIRDDKLIGGTKQRGVTIIKDINKHELVYASPVIGFAQIALSVGCNYYGKKATIFLSDDQYYTVDVAKHYGANIIISKNRTLSELQQDAERYVNQQSDRYLIPFGFDFKEYKQSLLDNILCAIPSEFCEMFVNTVWVVAGSATLLNILYKVFPLAKFGVCQVGKKIWPDQIEGSRTTLFIAPEFFYEDAKIMPPYDSAPKYDAKLWQFVKQYASSGDLIWNVAYGPKKEEDI